MLSMIKKAELMNKMTKAEKLEENKKQLEARGKVNMDELAIELTTNKMGKPMLREMEEMYKFKLARMEKAKAQKQVMMDVMKKNRAKLLTEAKNNEELDLIELIRKAKNKEKLNKNEARMLMNAKNGEERELIKLIKKAGLLDAIKKAERLNVMKKAEKQERLDAIEKVKTFLLSETLEE